MGISICGRVRIEFAQEEGIVRRECCCCSATVGVLHVCSTTYGGDQEAKGNGLLGARHAGRPILEVKERL